MTRETGDLVLTAFNARDWDNVVARFAPDGLFYLGPCAPCQGHTAIRKLLAHATCCGCMICSVAWPCVRVCACVCVCVCSSKRCIRLNPRWRRSRAPQ